MYHVTQSVASFEWVQHKKKFCGGSKLLCHLGRVTQQIQWWLNYQTEVLFIDFVRPLHVNQGRTLGFWSKVLPSSIDNHSPFEKQLLAS